MRAIARTDTIVDGIGSEKTTLSNIVIDRSSELVCDLAIQWPPLTPFQQASS